jgi:hypothetical protein
VVAYGDLPAEDERQGGDAEDQQEDQLEHGPQVQQQHQPNNMEIILFFTRKLSPRIFSVKKMLAENPSIILSGSDTETPEIYWAKVDFTKDIIIY